MEENKTNKKEEIFKKICEQVDKKLEDLLKAGIQQTNIDYVGKLVDVKKDIADINHKEMEEKNMMYRDYGNYGRDNYGNYDNYGARQRDSRGRYMGNNYDRRNYGNYRGHEMIDDMDLYYGTYMENRENGRYGSPETSKALEYMLKSVEQFIMTLKEDAQSQEEIEMIRKTARKISENV